MKFEVKYLIPEGWVVLSPWVQTLIGQEYRIHCGEYDSKEEAQNICDQLNSFLITQFEGK